MLPRALTTRLWSRLNKEPKPSPFTLSTHPLIATFVCQASNHDSTVLPTKMESSRPSDSTQISTSPLQLREILALVWEYADVPSFAALCRTCRNVHIPGTEILYESVTLDIYGLHEKRLDVFCDTVTNNPNVALLVKKLDLQLCTALTASIYGKIQDLPDARTLTKILRATENVERLNIDHPYHEITAIQPFGNDLYFPRKLRLLEFNVCDNKWEAHASGERDVNTLLLPQVFGMDALTSVTMTLQQGPASPLPEIYLPVQSSITALTLKEAYLSMESLGNVLQALPHLQHLSLSFLWYADPVNSDVGRHLDCEGLARALMQGSPSHLESLSIIVDFDSIAGYDVECGSGPDSSWGLLHSLGSLKHLNRLRSLVLAPEVLLGWGNVHEAPPLALLLPDSLQDLHLRMDFSAWEMTPWKPEPLLGLVGAYLDSIPPHTLLQFTLTYRYTKQERVDASSGPVRSKCHNAGCELRLDMVEKNVASSS